MIREARFSDVPAIIELGRELTMSGAWGRTSIDFKAATSRLLDAIRRPTEWLGVAEYNDRIVGFLILVAQPMWWNPGQWIVMDDIIYCSKPGYGGRLVKAGLRWIESLPVNVVDVIFSLNSGVDSERSAAALKCHGMERRGITMSFIPNMKQRTPRWAA
jgi:hypothetical protein